MWRKETDGVDGGVQLIVDGGVRRKEGGGISVCGLAREKRGWRWMETVNGIGDQGGALGWGGRG